MRTRSKAEGTIENGKGKKTIVRQKENGDAKDNKKLKKPPEKTKRIAKKGEKNGIQHIKKLAAIAKKNKPKNIQSRNIKNQQTSSKQRAHRKSDIVGCSEDCEQSSFASAREIDLSKVEVLIGAPDNEGREKHFKIKRNKKNQIILQTIDGAVYQQVYLGQEIDISKKYTLQFTVSSFSKNWFFIGLMPKQQVLSWIMYSGMCGFFFKRFASSSPKFDCSNVLKGSLFGDEVSSGDSYEMRFCIKEQILEFSTLPGHENVVSKLENEHFDTSLEGSYVITFCTYQNVGITVTSLQESSFFPSYC